MNWIMTQIEEAEEKLSSAIKHQEISYDKIKRDQHKDLKEYYQKMQDSLKLKLENLKLKDKDNS